MIQFYCFFFYFADELSIDNLVFKLFYKVTFALFLLGSLVGIFAQYIGDPINCDIKGIYIFLNKRGQFRSRMLYRIC